MINVGMPSVAPIASTQRAKKEKLQELKSDP